MPRAHRKRHELRKLPHALRKRWPATAALLDAECSPTDGNIHRASITLTIAEQRLGGIAIVERSK